MSSLNAVQHMSILNINDEWETRPTMLKDACDKYQIYPEIDVAASDLNHKFPLYFTKQSNALYRKWDRDFFMNPPYSMVTKFMAKAYEQSQQNNVNGLCLIFAKTDTKWWHTYVEGIAEVHFIQGRLKFLKDGKTYKIKDKKTGRLREGVAPYPSCWVIYRA